MKRSPTQLHVTQSRQQLRLSASGRMDNHRTGRNTTSTRCSRGIDDFGERIVELIVTHRNNHRICFCDCRR
jgi:hypothetical protein